MNDKKIDNIFQKHLDNLEVAPNTKVWNTIETTLIKKKRKVFPFWLVSSSIAAAFILGLILFPFSKDKNIFNENSIDEIITNTPKSSPTFNTNQNATKDSLLIDLKPKEEILIAKENEIIEKENKSKESVVDNKTLKTPKKLVNLIALNTNFIELNSNTSLNKTIINVSKKRNATLHHQKLDIHTVIHKKDSLQINNINDERWSVAPVFAVLKSNSFSNTSPIDANLSNSTVGESSFSYGVQVAYKLNSKWSIQSGIHLQEMSYANNQIAIFSASKSAISNTTFNNGETFAFNNSFADYNATNAFLSPNVVSGNGSLSQNYGYIEIPVEIKYNLLDFKKFGTQIVTGVSSLILHKNSLSLNLNNMTRTGEATNLNNINFSGNLGFDFNYFLNKNWSINLNPMFKVQFHTFSDNANGFSPFNIGVYSGITYKF